MSRFSAASCCVAVLRIRSVVPASRRSIFLHNSLISQLSLWLLFLLLLLSLVFESRSSSFATSAGAATRQQQQQHLDNAGQENNENDISL